MAKEKYPLLQRLAEQVSDFVAARSDSEIEALARECATVGITDAWWLAYDLAPVVRTLVDDEASKRRTQKGEVAVLRQTLAGLANCQSPRRCGTCETILLEFAAHPEPPSWSMHDEAAVRANEPPEQEGK